MFRKAAEVILFCYFFTDGREEFGDAITGCIMRFTPVQRINAGILDVPGGIEVRFTNREADDIDALPLDRKSVV